MESILDWIRREGIIFRGGFGSGINLSNLRSSKEQLSKGGYASGPVSFMRGADAFGRHDQVGRQDAARREDGRPRRRPSRRRGVHLAWSCRGGRRTRRRNGLRGRWPRGGAANGAKCRGRGGTSCGRLCALLRPAWRDAEDSGEGFDPPSSPHPHVARCTSSGSTGDAAPSRPSSTLRNGSDRQILRCHPGHAMTRPSDVLPWLPGATHSSNAVALRVIGARDVAITSTDRARSLREGSHALGRGRIRLSV
jgi:hypothetical protein